MDMSELVERHRKNGILVDTNLLVLLATGIYRRARISTFNRTRQYTPDDFDILVRLISLFQKRIVTPHIVAEADNLARQLPSTEHRGIAAAITALVSDSFEIYCPSVDATRHERYVALGVTDCTIVVASRDALVVTDDLRLSNILTHLGRDAININHIRAL